MAAPDGPEPVIPRNGMVYHIGNARHPKFLTAVGMVGGPVKLSSGSPGEWTVRSCPHEVGTFYLECNAAFLDTHGVDCNVWNNGGSSVRNLIDGNTSKHAGNLRWRLLSCPHSDDSKSFYIINARHGTFVDADQGVAVKCWNNGGSSPENIISGNTSKWAGNLRWYFTEV